MNDNTYNGWTNYETWNCKLWIDNDGSLEYWEEQAMLNAQAAMDQYPDEGKERATGWLANELNTHFIENSPEVTGFYADILSAALREVNWHEIARSIIDDLDIEWDSETENQE